MYKIKFIKEMHIHITPKITIHLRDAVGLVIDSKDKRCGEIFLVGNITTDESRTWMYIHHICPDGTHYTSRNIHPQASQLLVQKNLVPDVGPPELYLRHNGEHPLSAIMRQHGKSIFDLERDYKAIRGETGTLHRDYQMLFQEPFPLG